MRYHRDCLKPQTSFLPAVFKLAGRDLLSSRVPGALILLAMSLGIAGISGVGGASRTAQAALSTDSRQWLAADLSINTKDWIDEQQAAELERWRLTGSRSTIVTSTLSMAESDQSPDAVLIAVKAVDPAEYPFYGQIRLDPSQSLSTALGPDSVAVSAETLTRLEVHRGDTIRIGRQQFRIAAVILSEPDRFAGTQSAGPRCILSRDGYDRSGIARGGNTELHRVLLRLPAGSDVVQARHALEPFFPDANFIDFREANQQAVWSVETALAFLRVTAFIAMAVGSLGVALAVRQHIEQRLNTAFIMKILGARSRQVSQMFLLQILGLTLAAIALGIPLGWLVRASILSTVAKVVALPFRFGVDAAGVAESACAGLLAALPALAQPAILLRRIRVAPAFRRYVEEGFVETSRTRGPLAVVAGIALAGFVALAGPTLGSWNSAGFLIAGLVACVAAAFALTTLALRLIRRWMSRRHGFCLSSWGMGLANLYRPANRSRTLIVAMASALLMMIATFESTGPVSEAILNALPFDRGNLFIIGFADSDEQPIRDFLSHQAGLLGPIQMISMAWLRLVSVNDIPWERLESRRSSHAIASKWVVSCVKGQEPPAGVKISSDLARLLDAPTGTRIDFLGRDRTIRTNVSEIRRLTPGEKIWSSFSVDCGVLEGQNLYHHAALRVDPGHLAELRRMIHTRYPTLAVVSGDELLSMIQSSTQEAFALVRLVAWYGIGAGWSVLLAMVATSRLMRTREMGVLRALGANRRTLFKIYTVEFAAIGLLSGTIASVLACAFTVLVMDTVFERVIFSIDWKTIAAAIPITMAATVLAGWWPAYRLLGSKPIEALRHE
jgi:putative ABC transport system permease protein